VIEFIDVTKYFKKDKIFEHLNFKVNNNDFLIIEGHNGSGKSTIINLILNLKELKKGDSGSINNDFKSISYYPEKFVLPSLIKSHDFLYDYFDDILTKENIDLMINRYKLENKLICNLSKGNTMKIVIIKTLLENSELYIFDEPLNGLDEESKILFKDDLVRLNKENKTIILITHDQEFFKDSYTSLLKLGGDLNE
jgi:ABC-2 type transport system ATP-binding protein